MAGISSAANEISQVSGALRKGNAIAEGFFTPLYLL